MEHWTEVTRLHIHEEPPRALDLCIHSSTPISISANIKQLDESWLADAYLADRTIAPGRTAARPYHWLEVTFFLPEYEAGHSC